MTNKHTCHAKGCPKNIPPKLLMCLRHWRMVPRELQRAVWATYRPGQEVDKRPSEDYLKAARAAIDAVAAKETAQTAISRKHEPRIMNDTPTLLALDASSTTIGWVIFDGRVRAHGTIRLGCPAPKNQTVDISERCRQAFTHIGGLIESHPDLDCVAIESCVARFGGAVIPQARVSGAILTRVALFGLLVCEVTPQQAKKALCGRGDAEKVDMQVAALRYRVSGEHASDALGVALAAVAMVKVERVAA